MHLDLKTPRIFLSENLFVILTSLVCIRRQTIRSKWKKRSVPGLSLLESFVRKDSRDTYLSQLSCHIQEEFGSFHESTTLV